MTVVSTVHPRLSEQAKLNLKISHSNMPKIRIIEDDLLRPFPCPQMGGVVVDGIVLAATFVVRIIEVWIIEDALYIVKNKKVTKSVLKTGCEQKISKNYNCLNKKLRFQNANIRPCTSPLEYKPPHPPKTNLAKGSLTKNKPWGLLSEFYGILNLETTSYVGLMFSIKTFQVVL